MWAAYYLADEEMRYTIAIRKLRHQAEFEIEKFTTRMVSNGPPVEIYWTWTEEVDAEGREASDAL